MCPVSPSASARYHFFNGEFEARIMTAALTIRIFTPFALGYLLVSIFRSISAVIAPELVRDLGLGATELGFAVSALFLSGTIFQLPCGVLLDRYDPRRVYAILLVVSGLGAIIVALAEGVVSLALGRALIALGAAASAVTSYKVYSMWFPPERLPLVNGLSLAAGGLGLMAGTAPVEVALTFASWRSIHVIVGILLIACAGLVPAMAPPKPSVSSGSTLFEQVKGLSAIIRSMSFWRAAPLMMVVVGTFGAFTQLWAGPWVRDVAHLSRSDTANLLLVLTSAMTVSGLLTGALTAVARRFGLAPMEFALATAMLLAVVLGVLFLQWTPSPAVVFATWALFGFVASLNFVTYAALAPEFPPQLTGRLNACLTLSWMLGAFLIQNLYGIVLDLFPSGSGSYSIQGHRVAMGVIVLLLLTALAWFAIASRLIRSQKTSLTLNAVPPK
jgi:MFS family permease